MKAIKIITTLMLFILTLVSCTALQENNDVNANKTESVSVTITLNTTRTVMPSADIKEYKLYGNKTGAAEELLGTYTNLSTAVLSLEKGTWDFKLEAIKNDSNTFGSSTLTNQTLGDTPVTLSFTIANGNTTDKGTFELILNWPNTVPVFKYYIEFGPITNSDSIESREVAVSTNTFSYTNNTLDKGPYKILIKLMDTNSKNLCFYTEIVQIDCGLTSKKTVNLTEDDFNKKPLAPTNFTATVVPLLENAQDNVKVKFTWDDNSNNEETFVLFKVNADNSQTQVVSFGDGRKESTPMISYRGDVKFVLKATNTIGSSESNEVTINIPYLVKINPDGGSINGSTAAIKEHVSTASYTMPTAGVKTQDGITLKFNGYKLNDTTTYTASQEITLTSDLSLTAQYSVIGGTGPAGGIVFYDNGSVHADGWRYMEAAPQSTESEKRWGLSSEVVSGTTKAIGEGKKNTALILAALLAASETDKAAQMCDLLELNGFADWFLPSEDETKKMYDNLKSNNIGGFADVKYLTSSEGGDAAVNGINFSNGNQGWATKTDPFKVRAIRAFKSEKPTYSVTYNLNGATGTTPVDTKWYESGDNATAKDGATLTFTGNAWYGTSFGCWNTKADGSGVDYAAGAAVPVTGNLVLYAKQATLYKIWDNGPAGGHIFYINPNAATDGWMYLEAAPVSTEWQNKPWGGYGTEVYAANTDIGSGMGNTSIIVSALSSETDFAAKLCADLVCGGKDDWFLPCKDELNQIYLNLKLNFIGDFQTNYYFSSSEFQEWGAWSQNFDTGVQEGFGKPAYIVMMIRAARRF